MGISDDIKPKKVYRFVQPKNSKPKVAKKNFEEVERQNHKQSTEDLSPDLYENKDELEKEFFTDHEVKTKKKIKAKIPFGLITWVIVFVIVGVFFQKNISQIKSIINEESKPTSNDNTDEYYSGTGSVATTDNATGSGSSSAPATTTTPSTASINKADIKIEILNGNGIKGSADKIKTSLVADGFSVLKVANAQKFTYQSTYIYYKTGAESSAQMIKSALSSRNCILQLSDTLTKGYDIVIVVGAK